MTVITNLVVALMIVTSGEEPVQAKVVQHGDDGVWCWQNYGDTETLYRKTTKTNFVYSADVNLYGFRVPCTFKPYCNGFHYFTIDELFGKSISSIYFNYDEPIYCKEHAKMLGFIYTGGDK